MESKYSCHLDAGKTQTVNTDGCDVTFTGADIAVVLRQPALPGVVGLVLVVPALLVPALGHEGALLAVDELVYLSVSVLELVVLSTEVLGTDRSQGSTDTCVTAVNVQPGGSNVHLCPSTVPTLPHLPLLLDTELPGAPSAVLRAGALVTPVHVGVGLAHLVKDPVLVHTQVSLGIARRRISGAEFPCAGTASLKTLALVTVVGSYV